MTVDNCLIILAIFECVVPENIHTPHGRDFSSDPPSPLVFPKLAHKMDPRDQHITRRLHPLRIKDAYCRICDNDNNFIHEDLIR